MRRRTVVLLSLLGVVGVLLVAGVLLRTFGMDAKDYRVPSESMVPTVQVGDRVTLNQGAYDDAAPEIGDIVIHHPPLGADANECGETPPAGQMCARPTPERSDVSIIKRVVAGPGEEVSLEDGVVVRDGEPADEPYIADCGGFEGCEFPRPITVPQPTLISPSSDQSSWSITWLMMRGVSTRYWGSAAIAALK